MQPDLYFLSRVSNYKLRKHRFQKQSIEESLQLGRKDNKKPEVVYLDPMFPLRTKSAQVKKEMHVFHQLIGKDIDADLLLQIAQECAQKRVVVKRPRIAPFLAGHKPNYTLEGRSNRYDVYLKH